MCMGVMHSRLWRLVFCMGFKEIHKYLVIYALVLCTLDDFDCVLHGFCRFAGICLSVAWVLLFW